MHEINIHPVWHFKHNQWVPLFRSSPCSLVLFRGLAYFFIFVPSVYDARQRFEIEFDLSACTSSKASPHPLEFAPASIDGFSFDGIPRPEGKSTHNYYPVCLYAVSNDSVPVVAGLASADLNREKQPIIHDPKWNYH
jgi:hypothetical protein